MEFGRQMNAELARSGSKKVEAAMAAIHQRDPQRWGSRSKMYELWAQYRGAKGKLIIPLLRRGPLPGRKWISWTSPGIFLDQI